MKPSLREMLADSHTATVAIAVLLLWSLDGAFRALWSPVFRAVSYLLTAAAIFRYSVLPSNPDHDGPWDVDDYAFLSIRRRYQPFGGLALVAMGVWHWAAPPLNQLPQQTNREAGCLSG